MFLVVLLAVPLASATPATVIVSAGPLSNIWIGNELSCQVKHVNDASYQFYPPATTPGDCGTFVATAGILYAPDFANHGGTATGGLGVYTPFAPSSQSAVTGAGTAGSPFTITTVVTLPGTALSITEADRYVVGNDFYDTFITISNGGSSPAGGILYRAGDCFLGGADTGYGAVGVTAAGSVACTQNPNNAPAGRIEEFIPLTPGSSYYQNFYSSVWSWIGTKTPFPNTCACATFQDNGAGLSWNFDIAGFSSSQFANRLRFSVPPPAPGLTDCTAAGILATEADAGGGAGKASFAASHATTTGQNEAPVPALPPFPSPAATPDDHADANVATVTYGNANIALTATGVFSRCDVEMDSDSTGFAGQAYGRAGVADLTLTVAGTPIHLEALDFELEEMGVPASTAAYWACDAGEVRVGASTVAAACTLAGNVNGGNVQVLFHEVTGPTPAGAGRWSYQGSAVHIIVTGPVNANIYIGYVQTTLSGGAPGGPLYVPNGPCLTPLCN